MEKLISSLEDTAVYLNKQEIIMDSTIEDLLADGDKLKSFILLYLLAKKSKEALNRMEEEIPIIEERLRGDIDQIIKQAEEMKEGVKKHEEWLVEIIKALGDLCKDSDVPTRRAELHKQIEEMEKDVTVFINKRNEFPLDQL